MSYFPDISHHHKIHDFDAFCRAVGKNPVPLKCTEGTRFKDSEYDRCVREFKKRGTRFWPYHFLRGDCDVDRQFRWFMRNVGTGWVGLCIDCEPSGGQKPTYNQLLRFGELCEAEGAKVIVYFAHEYYLYYGKVVLQLKNCAGWVPRYGGKRPAYDKYHDLWQYTDKGKVPGISGNIDLNRLDGDKPLSWFTTPLRKAAKKEVAVKSGADAILKVARAWLGAKEGDSEYKEILAVYNGHKPLARGYKVQRSDEWCATFVSACSIKAGMTEYTGTECSCQRFIDGFRQLGIWEEDGTVRPRPGWLVLYNWSDSTQPNNGWADHIGIVEKVEGNVVTVIEGNINERVARRTVKVGWGFIRGYAAPKYPDKAKAQKVKKGITALAEEVLAGKWGNDPERTKRLTAAGYDAKMVQAKVNELYYGIRAD